MPHLAAAVAKAAITTCSDLPANLKTSDHSIFGPIAKPIADILAGFYSIVPNFGVAIILLSLAWMIIIAPLTLKSTRSMLAMQKLQPQLKKLQAEHKNDRQAFAQAQMDLYKEHNVSPFGSCLPSILPLPVFFALFRVIDGLSHKVKVGSGTHTLSCAVPSFLSSHTQMYQAIVAAGGKIDAFGLDLSKNALSGHATFLAALPFYILLLIMIGTQYLQTAQMMNRNPAAADNPQMKFMKYLPIIFGVVCIRFPAGVILYYAVSNICRMTQQTAMYRYDPKVKALVNQEVTEVETNFRRIEKGGSSQAPAPRSRFRDLLAQAQDSARAEKDKGKGTTPAGRPTTAAPNTKAGGKGQPPPNRPRPAGAKGNGPAKSAPTKASPAAKATPPAKANPATKTAPTKASPAAKGTPPATGAPPAKGSPGDGPNAKPAAQGEPRTGAGLARNGNGNGKSAPAGSTPVDARGATAANGNGATSSPPGSPPPAKTGGRTGAQAPRTSRRRRGR